MNAARGATTIDFAGVVVVLQDKIVVDHTCTADEAAWLQELWMKNICSALQHWRDQHTGAGEEAFRAEAARLAATYELGAPRHSGVDLVATEALAIARELLVARLSAEGLPIPKAIDDHAEMLVRAHPDLRQRAEQRIAARLAAGREARAGLGL